MRSKLATRALLSVISVALSSIILWGLADAKSEVTIVTLAFVGIIITTCIWFSLAWRIYDTKLKEAMPAVLISLAPYILTGVLDIYMAPYYNNDGGFLWASILDSYGNILYNSNYHLLAGWPEQSMISTGVAVLMMQILLPFALAFAFKSYEQKFLGRKRQ